MVKAGEVMLFNMMQNVDRGNSMSGQAASSLHLELEVSEEFH